MAEFDRLAEEYTKKGEASVHGLMAKCVDKHGQSLSITFSFLLANKK